MKRLVLILGILLGASTLRASMQIEGPFKSTQSATAEQFNILIATGPIYLKRVIVNTPAASSTLRLFNGSISTATAKLYETIDTSVNKFIDYEVIFSSGLFYAKTGSADITILWEWAGKINNQNTGIRLP